MRTHKRVRPCHKAFNVARDVKIVSKNVTMKYFKAQTKLPSHVEAQNTKRSGLQYSCALFRKGFTFVRLKEAFLKKFNKNK